ncbi:uncharacterized protein PV09_03630 [Verruconis gallopava]|uniref:NYN domain-containing protein n=1 Tax=Verruconis gallopava TaxID=253628 RepID=A0A0D2B397_9PEZI|nr:uncharacterized protein PV09_03630 [Verruconis gallopava]KIW05774.1 hypothetical protein PV09_03630 [Verruconis gallopava]
MSSSILTRGGAVQAPKQGVVHIYIDNSNLWIEGQKTYARKNHQSVSFDPTWRFDIGRLKDVLTRKSGPYLEGLNPEINIHLYGSTPPPVDTVWQAIKLHNVKVRTFERSSWTGREKLVDSELSLDSFEQALEDAYNKVRSEFMIVSGDKDMLSSVSRIDQRGFPVHVWSWKLSMTGAYSSDERLRNVKVHYLDDHLEEIGFCETSFRIDRNTIDPCSIVVLDPLPKADDIEQYVGSLTVPVYRYEYAQKRVCAASKDLVIIPALAQLMDPDDKTLLFKAAASALSKSGLEVITYFEYVQRFLKNTDPSQFVLELSNRFEEYPRPEDINPQDSQRHEAPGKLNAAGDDGYIEVKHWSEKRKKYLDQKEYKAAKRCMWGFYCEKGKYCKLGHTDAERDHFKTYGPKKVRKTKLCRINNCIKGEKCPFAHGEADLLCPTCNKTGVGHRIGGCLKK